MSDPYLKALDDATYVIEQSIATIKGESDYEESRSMQMSVAGREHVIRLLGGLRVQHPERHDSICSCQRHP